MVSYGLELEHGEEAPQRGRGEGEGIAGGEGRLGQMVGGVLEELGRGGGHHGVRMCTFTLSLSKLIIRL